MPSLKELRQHKRSIVSIHKLTSAMKMVSSAKFMKHQNQWRDSKKSLAQITSLAERLHTQMRRAQKTPLYLRTYSREKPTLLVIFSADKGLCGGFNLRIIKAAQHFIQEHEKNLYPLKIICIGQKAIQAFGSSPYLISSYAHLSGKYNDIIPLIAEIEDMYQKGELHDCVFLYNAFFNALRQEPHALSLLPIHLNDHNEGEVIDGGLLEYAPSFDVILHNVLSLLLRTRAYNAFKEHLVSEYSARMAAMGAATDNAETLMRDISLKYNRLRQSLITNELIEIISGAEAL